MLRIVLRLQLYWDFRELCSVEQHDFTYFGIKSSRSQVFNVLSLSCDNLLVWKY